MSKREIVDMDPSWPCSNGFVLCEAKTYNREISEKRNCTFMVTDALYEVSLLLEYTQQYKTWHQILRKCALE